MSGVSGSFEEGAEYSQVVFLSVLLRLSHPMFFQRDFPTGFFRPCFSVKLIGCSDCFEMRPLRLNRLLLAQFDNLDIPQILCFDCSFP